MSERRKFQSQKKTRIGVTLAFLVVLSGGGMLTYYSYEAVIGEGNSVSNNVTSASSSSRSGNSGSRGSVAGRAQLRKNSNDEIREAALAMEQQLMAKLERRNRDRRDQANLSQDPNYDLNDIKERVAEDYDEVKKNKQLSEGMKADFRKHYKNITLDTSS